MFVFICSMKVRDKSDKCVIHLPQHEAFKKESSGEPHNITFYDIPVMLIKDWGEYIWTWSLVGTHREHNLSNIFLIWDPV